MIKYSVYTTYTDTNRVPVFEFEDTWKYEVGEKIFYHQKGSRTLFVISHITHDVDENGNSLHRLYCQQKKAF